MIKQFLQIVAGAVGKNRALAWINIAGLAIALAASLIIVFYVQHETSYDKHWQHAERLYRLNTNFDLPGRAPYRLATTSSLLVPAMREAFADEIDLAARARTLNVTYRVEEERFKSTVVAVDPDFNTLFALNVAAGSLQNTLNDTAGIALREDQALRLFGTDDVLNRTLTIEYPSSTVDYRVTAVYRMPADNSVLELPALIRFDEAIEPALFGAALDTWYQAPVASYLRLKSEVNADLVRVRLGAISDNNIDVAPLSPGPNTKSSDRLFFDMSNISDLHLDPTFQNVREAGNRTAVQAFAVIAILILLIACINFAYLTLAKSDSYAAEVSIRKILGANKKQLLLKYLGESFVVVGMALLIGLVLVELLSPILIYWLGMSLQVDYSKPDTYLNIVGVYLLAALLGGLYPALMLSNFRPALVLKLRSMQQVTALSRFKNMLLVFQFGVAIALVIATSVIYLQVEFVSQRNPGFKQNGLVFITDLFGRQVVNDNKQVLREQIKALPGVIDASLSSYHPMATTAFARMSAAHQLEGGADESFILASTFVDESFFPTYDIALVAGRNFSLDQDQPALAGGASAAGHRAAIINEAATRFFGFSDPNAAIGKVLIDKNFSGQIVSTYSIIGVVADNQFYSLKSVTRPEIYFFNLLYSDVLSVSYTGSSDMLMTNLRSAWNALMGDAVFTASFIEPLLVSEFSQEREERQMLNVFSLFAIFIACLGLYGAATFSMEHRTKEIGIRKALGAQVWELVTLLLWQFSKPVLLANCIAWPIALWAMLAWLQRFPYQIDALILIPLCALAGFIAWSIAWVTVAGTTTKAASQRPVLALRYE
ncbi:MAG: ABC transporter permease [Pseudomonadales bacterium]|jgi:putative ABC transport system permease protein|nr:ABC transporter permease [Pseudomonadales bacterium]